MYFFHHLGRLLWQGTSIPCQRWNMEALYRLHLCWLQSVLPNQKLEQTMEGQVVLYTLHCYFAIVSFCTGMSRPSSPLSWILAQNMQDEYHYVLHCIIWCCVLIDVSNNSYTKQLSLLPTWSWFNAMTQEPPLQSWDSMDFQNDSASSAPGTSAAVSFTKRGPGSLLLDACSIINTINAVL